jgi:diguanylate cyclase (GGDEF)-like protein/PAS domain S-box-containing protein
MRALEQRTLGKAARPWPGGVQETVRRARIVILACALLALGLLGWSTWDHAHTAFELQRALGVQVAQTAEDRLMNAARDMRGRLSTFIHQETELLDSVAAHPSSSELRESLWSLLQLVLPRVGSALVLDANGIRSAPLGEPLGQDREIFLREYARDREGPFQVRGRGSSIVLSLAASWRRDGQKAGAILIDVSCAKLCGAIERTVPEGHHLRIRPAALGRPDRAAREGPSQSAADDGILLARVPLDRTGWVLEDRLRSGYFARIIYQRIALAIGLGAVFLAAALAMSRSAAGRGRAEPQEHEDPRETETQEQLRTVMSATMDGMIVTDLEGRIRLFNPAAEMMFGRLTEDVLNASAEKLLPDLFADGSGAPLLGQEMDTRAPIAWETVGVRKGGKDFPVRVWLHAVRFGGEPRLLIVVQDLTEHLRNEEQLAFLEQRDVLTGLLNRKEFEQRLSAMLSDANDQPGAHHVLCHIDVDQFKLINDTCGYQAGDELLRQLAILIEARLEEAELIARLGGDEFAALLLNRTAEQGLEICEGFRQTVRAFLFTWHDRSFDVAVSTGLVQFTLQSDSPSSIVSKADVACQMAKTRGRDRVHVYSQADVDLVRHHGDMRLVSTISQALSEGRFRLYAQPISPVAPGGGKSRHFEVLVRMVDGSGEQLIPGRFIPAAERYILMPSVDRWIINRLFSLQAENLRAWHESAPKGFLFAVNLSGTSITDEGFLRYLKRQFIDWRVPHDAICFEITETAAIRNLASARAFMQELSALGCTFALDDFGTGLSSYGYLKELPVDYLKIDGTFVRGMAEDPVSYALVESINQIGHVLGLQTIAEWAEDKNILNQLRALNVDYAQGFGIGQAIPVCDFTIAHATEPLARADQSDDPLRDTQRTHRSLARPA